MKDYFGYAGKNCVVTGAGSGMGEATAKMLVELGAEVYALDIKPVTVQGIAQYIQVDLSEKASIDHAFQQLPGKIDRYFGIAGLRGAMMPFMTVAKINLIANKYICEDLLPEKMDQGGAIVSYLRQYGSNIRLLHAQPAFGRGDYSREHTRRLCVRICVGDNTRYILLARNNIPQALS